jgi:hypothetical protein
MRTRIFIRNSVLFFCGLLVFSSLSAQDSSGAWHLTLGLNMGMVSTYQISGKDTGFANSLTQSPVITLGHKSGFSVSYSPTFVLGGSKTGLFMQTLSADISQYDKPDYSYDLSYSHYLFSSGTSVPYSPLNNEVYASFTYKKPWLNPEISAGIAFGTNTEETPSKKVSDIGISVGAGHSFDWDKGNLSYSVTPDIMLNAGTNDYFSFLKTTKYIGRSIAAAKLIKKGAAALAAKKKNARTGTSTTTTQNSSFGLSNLSLGIESSLETGAFTFRPVLNCYIPVGANAGSGLSAYWQLVFEYRL